MTNKDGYILDLSVKEAIDILDGLFLSNARVRGNGKSQMTYNITTAWLKIRNGLITSNKVNNPDTWPKDNPNIGEKK